MNSITSLSVQPITLSPLLCFVRRSIDGLLLGSIGVHTIITRCQHSRRVITAALTPSFVCLFVDTPRRRGGNVLLGWRAKSCIPTPKRFLEQQKKHVRRRHRAVMKGDPAGTTVGMFSYGMYAAKKDHIRTAVYCVSGRCKKCSVEQH